ncbi:cellulase family glycosylhydrolase, partial [Klebsiella pneumoniae]|nr:cellulase family glycosylhydrolase [Klebsiella pneumoniae]
MNTLQDAGVNMLRIPMGYWPFFSAQEVGEPYQNASHLDKLSEIMYGAWNRSIYVLIDLHGMPGSQNNDQSSGHNRTNLG